MRILSLDASTTTIGLAVIDYGDDLIPKLIHVEYFKPPQDIDIFEKLSKVRQFIFNKIEEFKPDQIALEDIVLFMKGKSTAATISSLAVLNRTVGLAVYDKLGKSPVLLNVLKIRHKIKFGKKLPAKEEIPELVAQILNISFPYQYNKKGKAIPENLDMADSIAVGLALFKINTTIEKPKKTRKLKSTVETKETKIKKPKTT